MATVATVSSINSDPPPEEKKSSSPLLIAIICCSIAFSCGLIYYWYIYSQSRITTDDAYVDGELSPINSRIMGFVSAVMVSEAAEVHKGDLLVSLDDSDVQIELKLKESRVRKASRDARRAEALKKSHAISRVDYENAQALLSVAEADLEGSKLKLRFTKVLSPFDGVIAKRSVQVGQFVQPGQSLLVLIPKKDLWIRANYKETQLSKVKIGQRVVVSVDAMPGHTWNGRVESIFPSTGSKLSLLPPENSTGNFTKIVQRVPVKIVLTGNNNAALKPGLSVETTILTEP